MLKSGFLYKNLILGGLVLLLLGCRKEINHEIGTTVSSETKGWQKISYSTITDLYALEVLNNNLYLGGKFHYNDWGQSNLVYYADYISNFVTPGFVNYYEGGVFDLEVHDGYLYVAGNFHESSQFDHMTLYKMSPWGNRYDVNLFNYTPMTINHLMSHGDTLIITGSFAPNVTLAPDLNTENVEFLQSDSPMGAAEIANSIYGSCFVNNELYICGTEGYFGYFTGASWGVLDYPNKSPNDIVYDITAIGNTIYLIGKFQGNTVLRTFNAVTGDWGTIPFLSSQQTLQYGAGFKWIGTELYVFGNALFSQAGKTTNVFKTTNGTTWASVGTITDPVRDLALYNGTLYAATRTGLFRLNP